MDLVPAQDTRSGDLQACVDAPVDASNFFQAVFRIRARDRCTVARTSGLQAGHVPRRKPDVIPTVTRLLDTNVLSEMMQPKLEPRVAGFLDRIAMEWVGPVAITARHEFPELHEVVEHRVKGHAVAGGDVLPFSRPGPTKISGM